MGGASLQVAVEIPEDQNLQSLSVSFQNVHLLRIPNVKSISLTFQASDQSQVDLIDLGFPGNTGGHKYRVFVTTFLGFGANEAMTRHRRSLVLSQLDKIDSRFVRFYHLKFKTALSHLLLEKLSVSPRRIASRTRVYHPD